MQEGVRPSGSQRAASDGFYRGARPGRAEADPGREPWAGLS
jgi:hypothetical protein